MKLNTLMVAATLALAAGPAPGDPPTPPQGQHRPPIDRLSMLLDLNDGQKAAVEKVFEEQHAKMEGSRQQAQASSERPSREEMQHRREQMDQEMLEQLKPILTEQQLQKFAALQEERRQRPPGPPPQDRERPESGQ